MIAASSIARKRSGRQPGLDVATRVSLKQANYRIEFRVDGMAARQRRLEHFARRDLALTDQLSEPHGIMGHVFLNVHIGIPLGPVSYGAKGKTRDTDPIRSRTLQGYPHSNRAPLISIRPNGSDRRAVILNEARLAVEDHCRAPYRVVGGPLRNAGIVR